MKSIGSRVKNLREIQNFTQEYMAGILGMSASGYGKIERDETDIPFSRLEQIASILKINMKDIIDFDGMEYLVNNMHNSTEKGNNAVIVFNNLSDSEKQTYLDQINTLKSEVEYLKSIIEFLKEQLVKKKE